MSQDNNWQQQVWQQPQPQSQQPQPAYPQSAYGQPQPPNVPSPQQKKSRGWIVALVAVILFFALMFFGLASCTSALASFGSIGSLAASSSSDLDYLSHDAVGVITLDGTIQYDGTTCSPEGLKAQLDRAEQNPHIKAVVLRVNSGGGTATAGEEMAEYLREFSKPVVVSSASINASAAYEISSQADYIFTAKTTSIGAIGTVMQVTDQMCIRDRRGIVRFGSQFVPMDEALVLAACDVSGRGQLHYDVALPIEIIGTFDTTLAKEFFIALAANAGVTLHVRSFSGENAHHIVEAAFKAAGRALSAACALNPRIEGVLPSTKGAL